MRKWLNAGLLLGAVLVLSGSASAKSPQKSPSFYGEAHTTGTVGNQSRSIVTKMWFISNTMYRADQVEGPNTMIRIENGTNVWLLDPKTHEAHHISLPANIYDHIRGQSNVFGNELVGLKSAGVKKIGVEVVDKVKCVHYQSTVQGLTVNLWTIPSQRNRTLKVVSDGKAGPQQIPIHLVTVYQNWKWNIHEPATYFKPPAGYKVVEMALPMMPGPPAKK